jgi:Spy/CpxP family protein refolding chaperone
MRTRSLAPLFALALTLTGGAALFAQHGGGHPAGCPMNKAAAQQTDTKAPAGCCPLLGDLKALELTSEQTQKVTEIQTRTQKTVTPLCETERTKKQAIAEALKADKPNATAIKKLVAEAGAARTACQQAHIDAVIALKGVLTAAQFTKVMATCPMMSGGGCGMQGKGAGCGMQAKNGAACAMKTGAQGTCAQGAQKGAQAGACCPK